MASFVGKLLVISVPIAAMIGVSVAIDPANLFHEGPEPTIAAMLLAGRPVAGLVDYDDRLVQKHYIDGLPTRKDVIVLGSSRAMQIRATEFPGRSFFNHSMTGGVLDDYVAVARQYEARDLMPRLVVVGLDPWLLSASANSPSESHTSTVAKLREAVSPSYFQAALRSFKAYGRRPRPREPSQAEQGGTTLADGSRVYPRTTRERTPAQVRAEAVGAAATLDERLRDFHELDENLVRRLESFIGVLRARGAEVEFLLAPYHAVVLEGFHASDEYRMVFTAEQRFRDLAASLNVRILGAYDPAACGCDESEFLDGGHPRETCMTKILDGRAIVQ